jgi:hypothetical protein
MLPETWSEPLRWSVLVSAAVVGALFVAEFSERRKEGWRRSIEGMVGRMERGLWNLQTSRAR